MVRLAIGWINFLQEFYYRDLSAFDNNKQLDYVMKCFLWRISQPLCKQFFWTSNLMQSCEKDGEFVDVNNKMVSFCIILFSITRWS